MNDSIFLLARLSAEQLITKPLEWLVHDRLPYRAANPLDISDEVLDQVFRLYRRSYAGIGKHYTIRNKYGLLEYNRWVIVTDAKDNPTGFVLAKTTHHGLKICLTGTDGTQAGKEAVKSFHRRAYLVEGVYAEVSHAVEKLVAADAPRVRFEIAMQVLAPKELNQLDGFYYERSIQNLPEPQKKLMVGKPKFG